MVTALQQMAAHTMDLQVLLFILQMCIRRHIIMCALQNVIHISTFVTESVSTQTNLEGDEIYRLDTVTNNTAYTQR